MSENAQNVFAMEDGKAFRTSLTVSKSGFYRVRADYTHSHWDAWLKLTVTSEKGETFTSVPPLPKKDTQAIMLWYLFEGVNHICLAPRYDQPVVIKNIEIIDEAPELKPRVTPAVDYFYLSKPLTRRLTLESYTGAPLKITAADREIPFELEDKALYDHGNPVETKEPLAYYHLRLHPEVLFDLGEGDHQLTIHLPEGECVVYTLKVKETGEDALFKIVSLDVGHGNCVLLRLPNGKNLLIDTGVEQCAEDVIFPYLKEHGIGIDYCVISHYHGDHMGGLNQILAQYPIAKPDENEAQKYMTDPDKRAEYLSRFGFLDNRLVCRYDRLDKIWDLGGVEITVLNSKYEASGEETEPGCQDENFGSLSMLVSYRGFRYYHGADNYVSCQERYLADYTAAGRLAELECQYMQANHHFHGDTMTELLRAINPVAVLVPADQAIYSRSAFMVDYLQGVVEADFPNKRLQDTLVSYTSGSVCVSVNSGDDWRYETF